MDKIPDHPVIANMERYGYPKSIKVIHQCSWCDEPIYEGEECFDLSPYGFCCQHCMDERLITAGEELG